MRGTWWWRHADQLSAIMRGYSGGEIRGEELWPPHSYPGLSPWAYGERGADAAWVLPPNPSPTWSGLLALTVLRDLRSSVSSRPAWLLSLLLDFGCLLGSGLWPYLVLTCSPGLNPQPWWLMGTSSPDRSTQPGSLQPGVAHSPLSGLGSLLDAHFPSALPSRPDRSLSRFPPHQPAWTSSRTQETHLAPGWAPRQSSALGHAPQVLGPSIC